VTTLVISTQMAGLALLGGDGRPLGPVILGVDRRGEPVPYDPRTGCPPGAIYPAGKLAWLAAHEPRRLAAARYVGGVKSALVRRLCGAWVTDPSSASATGLYDVTTGRWLDGPRNTRREYLPRVLRPRDLAGHISSEAAAELGLPAGTPLLVGIGDGPAANLACGAAGGSRLCLSLGTTLVARLLVRGRVVPDGDLPFFVQHVDGDWHCVGVRLDLDGDAYSPVGAPRTHVSQAELPMLLSPLLEMYGVTELRPVGSRCRDEDLVRRLAAEWGLPVRMSDAYDGTRGAALLALDDRGDLATLVARVPVTADVTPEGIRE
jgi:sugar (pentulose or hexulose) kinase